jgi:hypothetical protein
MIPVLGPPPHWKWFPRKRRRFYTQDPSVYACDLWKRYFERVPGRSHGPSFYWSTRMGRRRGSDGCYVEARCYHWGIVVSRARYIANGRKRRWLTEVLKHELLHWAGYSHDRRFRAAAKRLGTQ